MAQSYIGPTKSVKHSNQEGTAQWLTQKVSPTFFIEPSMIEMLYRFDESQLGSL
jgi:hypothetical protein